jgi:hypothetical protein
MEELQRSQAAQLPTLQSGPRGGRWAGLRDQGPRPSACAHRSARTLGPGGASLGSRGHAPDPVPARKLPRGYYGTGRTNLDYVPVLCIGGSDGLAPTEASFADYLGSIATPPADKQIFIAEGYAHLDVLTAKHNIAVPYIVSWMSQLLQRKLLGTP